MRWQKGLWKPKRDGNDGSGSLNEMAEMALKPKRDGSDGSGSLHETTVMALEA